ncbi:C4-dicarboxylate TRAP transporter large permease protein DctM [Paenibacillus solanacearum]|uniref:C4-dicarboxylate TRAP transporter large permease protein DctM n=1 Tax=Paenibacillus solanacearum TaxID=2048548 RepID=A0A916K4H6_9BACL|nr:TRAP transporter large permease [Paenibacillus solanacearum]CAG7635729.1 C4-dicarboxylate TRAP transporter large permease protein DctM [Paenibacillus solanacearum]
MAVILMICMLAFFAISVPIAVSMGLASGIALWWDGGTPLIVLVQRSFTSVDSFPLMAIPFFILAGTLMEYGGISKRLIALANALTGHLPGGLAIVTIVTAMFFSAISGSSAATTAALGSMLIPAMVKRGYHPNFAGATQAVAGELGVIIPPSIPMILFGVSASVSIGDLFMAGFVPGILIGFSLILTVLVIAKRRDYKPEPRKSFREVLVAFKDSFLALLMPVIILGGIYGGVFTPTEAAGVAVGYAFIVGVLIYKEIKLKQIFHILTQSTVTTATIMFIISSAGLFGWIITRENVPQMVAQFFMGISDNPVVFLLLVNLFLLIVGMFMETNASIIILAPLLLPVAINLGIDPVHFGIIMIVNLALGMCTPPLGVNLFISAQLAKIRLDQISKGMLPYYVVLLVTLLLITFVPSISTGLVHLFK